MRRARVLLMVAAVMAALAITPTASATTAAGWADCHVGELCLYVDANGQGDMFAWSYPEYTSDFRLLLCYCKDADFHNDASSWWNRTGRNWCVSDGTFGGNPDNTMPAGTRGNFTPSWNDRASSISHTGCP